MSLISNGREIEPVQHMRQHVQHPLGHQRVDVRHVEQHPGPADVVVVARWMLIADDPRWP